MEKSLPKKILKLDSLTIAISIVVILIILFFISDFVQIFLHSLINIFAGGRTSYKALLFLIYFLFLIVALKLTITKKKVSLKLSLKWWMISIFAIAYFVNLFSIYFFYQTYHLQISDSIVIFNELEISSTSLLHNHILKGVTGLLFQLFNVRGIENIDGGMVFLSFTSHVILLIGLILLIILLVSTVLFYLRFIRTLEFSKSKLIYTLIYTILSFSLIKNFIDGGPLNYEMIVSFAFLPMLVFNSSRLSKYFSVVIVVLYLLANLLFFRLHLFSSYVTSEQGLFTNVWVTSSYTFLLIALFYHVSIRKWDRKGIMLTILALCLCFYPIFMDLSILAYRAKTIDNQNHAILGTYETILNKDYQYLSSLDKLHFYEISPSNPITAGEVINTFHLLDNLYPLSFPWQNCLPSGLWDQYSFELISEDSLETPNIHSEIVNFDEFKKIEEGKWNKYQVKLSIKPCYPRLMNIIDESVQKTGIHQFMIVNIVKGVRRI